MRSVTVGINNRANLRISPLIEALENDPAFQCKTMGISTTSTVPTLGVAMSINQWQMMLENEEKPDFLVLIGDRYETLGAAIAAHYARVCIVHLQGGEVSGTRDDGARDAITRLSHYHVPATLGAKERLLAIGELPATILATGCPSSDLAFKIKVPEQRQGVLLMLNSDTDLDGRANQELALKVGAEVKRSGLPVRAIVPNVDESSSVITRVWQELQIPVLPAMSPSRFYEVLAGVQVAVGNSSALVRESGFFGTPVALVGERQTGRELGRNVSLVPPEQVYQAVCVLADHGSYPPDTLYGDGKVCQQILQLLMEVEPYYVKQSPHSWSDSGKRWE